LGKRDLPDPQAKLDWKLWKESKEPRLWVKPLFGIGKVEAQEFEGEKLIE
jgi:hypothetical protein